MTREHPFGLRGWLGVLTGLAVAASVTLGPAACARLIAGDSEPEPTPSPTAPSSPHWECAREPAGEGIGGAVGDCWRYTP